MSSARYQSGGMADLLPIKRVRTPPTASPPGVDSSASYLHTPTIIVSLGTMLIPDRSRLNLETDEGSQQEATGPIIYI